ncbi:hypothetical protein [Herbaspirillum sp. BH-1]|uniref:hypothetical protein n=1 Tax=Herbaspirillum sp. (strain BH-1) TaxID=2058884 RepID=UPI000C886DFC|nr:hypothetical protein [Herbaspirillum sp. BH-1]
MTTTQAQNQNPPTHPNSPPASAVGWATFQRFVAGFTVAGLLAICGGAYKAGVFYSDREASKTIDDLKHKLLNVQTQLKLAENDSRSLREKLVGRAEQLKIAQEQGQRFTQNRQSDIQFLRGRLITVDAELSAKLSENRSAGFNREDDATFASRIADLRQQRDKLMQQIVACQ